MRLPDDFWSVNEDEPGPGGVLIAGLVLFLCLFAILGALVLRGVTG